MERSGRSWQRGVSPVDPWIVSLPRALDERVESIVDSHDGTDQIQHPHWYKGASHEWGSLIPMICANVSLFALENHTARVKELVAEQPDSTLAELQVRLAKEYVNVSQSAISRFLHHINMSFKKKHTRGGTRSARRCRGP
jgi:hypothetical protein